VIVIGGVGAGGVQCGAPLLEQAVHLGPRKGCAMFQKISWRRVLGQPHRSWCVAKVSRADDHEAQPQFQPSRGDQRRGVTDVVQRLALVDQREDLGVAAFHAEAMIGGPAWPDRLTNSASTRSARMLLMTSPSLRISLDEEPQEGLEMVEAAGGASSLRHSGLWCRLPVTLVTGPVSDRFAVALTKIRVGISMCARLWTTTVVSEAR